MVTFSTFISRIILFCHHIRNYATLLFGPSTRTAGTEEEGFSGSEQGGVLSLLTSSDLIFSFLFLVGVRAALRL